MKKDTVENKMTDKTQQKISQYDIEKSYWQDKLSGSPAPIGFPGFTEDDRQLRESFSFQFDEELSAAVLNIGAQSHAGVFLILVSGVMYLLHRYNSSNDIIVAAPSMKGKIYGTTANTLVLRTSVEPGMTFKQLLLDIKQIVSDADKHMRFYPHDEIVKHLKTKSVETAVRLDNIHPDSQLSTYLEQSTVMFHFSIENASKAIEGKIDFLSTQHDDRFIPKLSSHLRSFLHRVTSQPEISLDYIDLLDEKEKQHLLYDFNDTFSSIPQMTIWQLVEEQVEKQGDNEAILFSETGNAITQRITYRQLDERARKIACWLKAKHGVEEGDIVALNAARDVDMICGILGILKLNAVCLPLDPNYPAERIQLILKDSAAKAVIDTKVNGWSVWKDEPCGPNPFENRSTDPNLPAYIIYTSGSTGTPRGVLLTHGGINNHTFTKISELECLPEDRFCHSLSINFVASIWQSFTPFILGAPLVLYQEEIMSNSFLLFQSVDKHGVTILEVVPSVLSSFLDLPEEDRSDISLSGLKKLVLTGEKVLPSLVDAFYSQYQVPLVNAYGQSECSDDTLHYAIPLPGQSGSITSDVPIGKPSLNTSVYILYRNKLLQPIGAPGELYISGAGLAMGYLNRPELSHHSFVDNPFGIGKMYATGDFARWNPGGNVQYIGRTDHQVKIRGFRVELGEIESRLRSYPSVKDAVVILHEFSDGEKDLCSYIVVESGMTIEPDELEMFLREKLPDYMIPLFYIQLSELPLTPNGKIDRSRLPAPELPSMQDSYVAPANETEWELIQIMARIMKKDPEKIGVGSNFFQLGGNSLKAVSYATSIQKQFQVDVTLLDIFERPTIKQLAEYIGNIIPEQNQADISIVSLDKANYYPLSAAQKRLFVLQQLDSTVKTFNMPYAVVLEGKLRRFRLEQAFQSLIQRHESFRTSFTYVDGEPVQIIADQSSINLEYREFEGNEEETRDKIREMIHAFVKPFDLSKAPLMRAQLIKAGERKHVLIVDLHHIISDGTSMAILIKEFMALYAGETLAPLDIHYKEFAQFEKQMIESGEMANQETYWLNRFDNLPPLLELGADFDRPEMLESDGSSNRFQISVSHSRALKQMALDREVTLFIMLLAVYNVFLAKLSGNEDIVVGTGIAGRDKPEFQKVVGIFVNTLALRNYPTADLSFSAFLAKVRTCVLEAFKYPHYPFDELAKHSGAAKRAKEHGRHPLFDAAFSFNNIENPSQDIPEIKAKDLTMTPYTFGQETARYDITLRGSEAGETLYFSFNYRTHLFKQTTIQRFITYFKDILDAIIADPDIQLKEIKALSQVMEAETESPEMDFTF